MLIRGVFHNLQSLFRCHNQLSDLRSRGKIDYTFTDRFLLVTALDESNLSKEALMQVIKDFDGVPWDYSDKIQEKVVEFIHD